jgi:hypothetical protein
LALGLNIAAMRSGLPPTSQPSPEDSIMAQLRSGGGQDAEQAG